MKYFDKLCKDSIVSIFIGDINYGWLIAGSVNYSMPYLTKKQIAEIGNKFNYPVDFDVSRKEMMKFLFEYCNRLNTIENLLLFLLSKGQFSEKLKDLEKEQIDSIYESIIKKIVEEINKILYFDNIQAFYTSTRFQLTEIKQNIKLSNNYNEITSSYIWDLQDRIKDDLDAENYDSVITKSRTLIEEVFCYVIEKKNETPTDSGDINKLYQQVKNLYNMHQDKNMDKRINSLLSGLEKIISSISDMRNKDSDSHGVGSKRIRIKNYHCLLFVNSAITISDFILSVSKD